MPDNNMTSLDARMDDTEDKASSSNLPATELIQGGSFGLPTVTSQPPSRAVTRPGTPTGLGTLPGPAGIGLARHPLSGHSTPIGRPLESILQIQEEELLVFRNGLAAAAH
jgi:hypothetical protein